jgi:hypothetical protein
MTEQKHKLMRIGPRILLFIVGGWAISMAATLLGPGDVLDKYSAFHILARVGLPGSFWGGLFTLNWAILWFVVFFQNVKPLLLYLTMIVSGPFWLAMGGALFIGSISDKPIHYSGGGLFCIFLGIMSIVSCAEMGGQM